MPAHTQRTDTVLPTRRVVTVTATALCAAGLVAAVLPAPDAQAWGNGGDRKGPGGTVRNGYGTHDWIVDQAYRIAGGKAGVGGWFDPAVARRWSGYPDVYRSAATKGDHVFKESGGGRGAAQKSAEYYVRTVRAYQSGDYRDASKWFGIMAHYVGDVSMPYHAKADSRDNSATARRYEVHTSGLTSRAGAAHDLCPKPASLPRVTDARQVISDIARRSRPYAGKLRGILTSRGPGAARAITRKVLPLSCNSLASLLRSIPRASAMPARVARVKVRLIRTKVVLGRTPKIDVSAFDSRGRRIDGAEVRVDWPGTKHDGRFFTMPNGPKRNHGGRASSSAQAKVHVTVLDPGGPGALTSKRGSRLAGQAVTVTKGYRTLSLSQLKKARKKARKAGKPWRP